MFRSKIRDIIIPQSEHARFAGMIARNWGNAYFDRPDFDFDSFVAGVALHDLGHGFFDTNEIGAMDDKQAYTADNGLVRCRLPDPVVDAVAHFHILRLLNNHPEYSDLIDKCQQIIDEDIELSAVSREKFLWADKITQLCDYSSFDFCFEKETDRNYDIAAHTDRHKTIQMQMYYDGCEKITLNPWPLAVDQLKGFIMAYQADGYPRDLKPVLKKYVLLPG